MLLSLPIIINTLVHTLEYKFTMDIASVITLSMAHCLSHNFVLAITLQHVDLNFQNKLPKISVPFDFHPGIFS